MKRVTLAIVMTAACVEGDDAVLDEAAQAAEPLPLCASHTFWSDVPTKVTSCISSAGPAKIGAWVTQNPTLVVDYAAGALTLVDVTTSFRYYPLIEPFQEGDGNVEIGPLSFTPQPGHCYVATTALQATWGGAWTFPVVSPRRCF